MKNEEWDNMMRESGLKLLKENFIQVLKNDPKFKEEFLEELIKMDDTDKGLFIDIGLPAKEVEDNKMRYTIGITKRTSSFGGISMGSISMSRGLLRSLYSQLKELDEKGELKP
jgi:hypothetical protein